MTFKTIEYMLAILEEGGFSRAAQRLYISQPALSQAIRKAEEEIGTPLFVRDARSIHLTGESSSSSEMIWCTILPVCPAANAKRSVSAYRPFIPNTICLWCFRIFPITSRPAV